MSRTPSLPPAESAPARVLIVDDEPTVLKVWRHMLNKDEFVVELFQDAASCLQAVARQEADVVVTDVMMAGMTGLQLLQHLKETHPATEVIVMTGEGKFADAVFATKAGAFDYITKPFVDIEACINRVRQAVRIRRLAMENTRLRERVDEGALPDVLESNSPVMRPVLNRLERVARVDATVLITGQTGTGKSLIARTLHDRSPRRHKPFVYVDCGTIAEELIEAELFGHEKGSFTGAVAQRQGLFAEANGGTLFLDEIGDMPLSMQPKLLRVLNDGRIRPVGSARDVQVDVRVISATHVDLPEAISAGRFREDLFYRLNVVSMHLPSLNERREDIPPIAYRIVRRVAARQGSPVRSISDACMERLLDYDWQGNIRELENVLIRAMVFETSDELSLASLPDTFRSQPAVFAPLPEGAPLINLEMEWKDAVDAAEHLVRASYLRGVLERYDGNVTQAAKHANLDRSNFRRHLKRHLPDYKER